MKFWYWVCYGLASIGLFIWHPFSRFHGRENIPDGGAVFCSNHASAADAVWVLLALRQPNMIRVMAKNELHHAFFIGWVMEKFRIIFVHRGKHDTKAFDTCISALENDEKLLMFIEGTRWRPDKDTRAKTGAFRMAAQTDKPIVPVYVTRNKKPFAPVDVIIGKPFKLECGAEASHETLQRVADETLYEIYKMGGDTDANHVGRDSGLLLRS